MRKLRNVVGRGVCLLVVVLVMLPVFAACGSQNDTGAPLAAGGTLTAATANVSDMDSLVGRWRTEWGSYYDLFSDGFFALNGEEIRPQLSHARTARSSWSADGGRLALRSISYYKLNVLGESMRTDDWLRLYDFTLSGNTLTLTRFTPTQESTHGRVTTWTRVR